MSTRDVDDVVAALQLGPHPEGGWYRETFRDDASSAILYALRTGERSHWHRVRGSAEAWHHYLGDALALAISVDGIAIETLALGTDFAGRELPQAVVPADAWQSAAPIAGGPHGFTLVGCTVAPPFRFEAFELAPPGWAPG